MEPDWPLVSADHCNEKKPIQTYRLVPINENVLMADYLTELDRAAKESSTDELDRRYRTLLSGISQEDLNSADRLLRDQGWISEPHSVRRRLFDDHEEVD